jgi:hypothetical protein
MQSTQLYEGEVCNGIKCELHEATSFSGRQEIALMLDGKIITVISVERKTGGKINCKVAESNKLTLMEKSNPSPAADLDLGEESDTPEDD